MRPGNINEVDFNEDEHYYSYKGKRLNGITGIIAKRLGKNFPRDNARVQLACNYGSQVHKESELWINDNTAPVSDSGKWVVEKLKEANFKVLKAELRVSDFEGTASNVDIVGIDHNGAATLMDIKTGNYNRPYCTMQLNAYRMMFENCYQFKVSGMLVLCTKTKRVYRILQTEDNVTLELLEANKNV